MTISGFPNSFIDTVRDSLRAVEHCKDCEDSKWWPPVAKRIAEGNVNWSKCHVPHVGSRYGRSPRVAFLGLDDYRKEDGDATDLKIPNPCLELRRAWDRHRKGEAAFVRSFLRPWLPVEDQDVLETNPFAFVVTLNRHLCSLVLTCIYPRNVSWG